ncbi:MAG: MetQ/NlpA family ABC transporter substrate-binding protein [Coprobacillaceae bacterium]
MKKIITLALSLLLAVSLTGCGSDSKDDDVTVVYVGVVGEYNDQWDTVNELLEKDNIRVELKKFSDYTTPNRALDDGEIDLNSFQHKAFLNNDIEKNKYDIVSIGDTIIAPLAIFNNKDKISSIEDIKDGDTIAIPSDATNGGRALKLLEEAGLIVCDPTKGFTPTKLDITEYKVKIEILEAESGTLASLLPDCAAAIINGGNAFTAGLNPTKDSIFIEDVETNENISELVNVIVARSDDKDNEIYKKVVKAYQSTEVEKTLEESYQGAFIPAWK